MYVKLSIYFDIYGSKGISLILMIVLYERSIFQIHGHLLFTSNLIFIFRLNY